MHPEPEEPALPYTPSNTGRRARGGYLGFDGVGFNDRWPLFAGLVLSIILALRFFLGEGADGNHWLAKTIVALVPFAVGFGYLRFLVVGRPPHFKGDLSATSAGLRLDFTDPRWSFFPLWPRVVVDASAATGPARPADHRHPIHSAGAARHGG